MIIYENKKLPGMLFLLKPISSAISLFLPNLKSEIAQSNLNAKKEDFISISLFMALLNSVMVFFLIEIIFNDLGQAINQNTLISMILALVTLIFSLFSNLNYPKLIVLKKVKSTDNALLFALRHVLIKIRSGIPFFDALVSISYNNYGQVSVEFRKVIKDIQAGTSEVEALEKVSMTNSSFFFRKFIWQVTNSLRAGTDIETALTVIVKNLQEDRYIKIKEFGNKLSPIALMYIIFTVIFPTIILTIFSITSFFFEINVGVSMFFIVPAVLTLFNFFFMSVINSSMPPLSEDY
ncbi:MAG: type II secretion system F family protein [Candidatus Nanoarchaeia archaeon]|nr:type II secretion system F family protein [Candidatus Nanoarchaeia archaeon]